MNANEDSSWFEKGQIYENQGRYYEAISVYGQGLESDPLDYRLWSSIGDLVFEMGHYEDALENFDKALEAQRISDPFCPPDEWLLYQRKEVLFCLNKPSEGYAAKYLLEQIYGHENV